MIKYKWITKTKWVKYALCWIIGFLGCRLYGQNLEKRQAIQHIVIENTPLNLLPVSQAQKPYRLDFTRPCSMGCASSFIGVSYVYDYSIPAYWFGFHWTEKIDNMDGVQIVYLPIIPKVSIDQILIFGGGVSA